LVTERGRKLGAVCAALLGALPAQAAPQGPASLNAISLDRKVGVSGGDGPVDCRTLTDCTFITDDPGQGAHNPAILFEVSDDAIVHLVARIWSSADCPGDPDMTTSADLPMPGGLNLARIIFSPPLDDGTVLSVTWSIGQCAVTACANYVLGTPPPNWCEL
jgi:hypothetical protein